MRPVTGEQYKAGKNSAQESPTPVRFDLRPTLKLQASTDSGPTVQRWIGIDAGLALVLAGLYASFLGPDRIPLWAAIVVVASGRSASVAAASPLLLAATPTFTRFRTTRSGLDGVADHPASTST